MAPKHPAGSPMTLGGRSRMMLNRTAQFISILFAGVISLYCVLALAQVGSNSSCHWAFPRWFGCVLAAHETLAGGLIGAAGVIIGAWIAWMAVQQQINAERERTTADRAEAERLLSEDLPDYADGMAEAWKHLETLPEGVNWKEAEAIYNATAYMAAFVSRAESISSFRGMIEILGWDRRRKYTRLISGLESLNRFSDAKAIENPGEVLEVIRNIANDFEVCLPDTSKYFMGLWRRTPKAMSFAMMIEFIAGVVPFRDDARR
jgi:hypothetical protein